MRVAIVTIISENYGNRLQNYALQQTLTKTGCNVHTLFPEIKMRPKVIIKNIIKGLIIWLIVINIHTYNEKNVLINLIENIYSKKTIDKIKILYTNMIILCVEVIKFGMLLFLL